MKKISLLIAVSFFLILAGGAGEVSGQPSDALVKKHVSGAKTVSVALDGAGKLEWSKTYKKYVWTRYFTAKLRTDEAGVFVIVKGYAVYDVVGGRYVFWRTFTSGNNYEGKKNPSVAEINRALEAAPLDEFTYAFDIIGEFESLKLAPDPDWEWHTPDSVSFTVVAVFRTVNRGGGYGDEAETYQSKPGFQAIDRLEAYRRIRLYRKGGSPTWNDVGVSSSIPTPESKYRIYKREKLLDREVLPEEAVKRMPRVSRVPTLSQ